MKKLNALNLGKSLTRNEMKSVSGGLVKTCFSQLQCQITGGIGIGWSGDGNNYCSASGVCVHAG